MFGKQAVTNFYRLNFANKSGWFIVARAYIYLLQLALLIALVLLHFSEGSTKRFWGGIVRKVLIPLEFTSVPLHTLVCSVIGMDKIYILHLIFSGIFWGYRTCRSGYHIYVSKDPDYATFAPHIPHILTMLAYWIFNIRTKILYLSTFRFAVDNTDIDNRTLFRRIFKWWILMHLILIPYHIWSLFEYVGPFSAAKSISSFYLMRILFGLFELKMYLSLTPDTEKWSYIFSRRSHLLEKFYVFSTLFYVFSWLTGLASSYGIVMVPDQVHRYLKIIGETMFAIRWVWLYFYAKKKLEDFVFQCIDEDSNSDFFDEFEFASKSRRAAHPWTSIDEYEPKRTLDITINV